MTINYPLIIIVSNMKKKYMKPEQRIIVLQHQSHLLQASGERNLRSVSGPFDYEGSDEGYEGDVR